MTPSSMPVLVPNANRIQAISTGGANTCAINDGEAICWGDNAYGQLGNGTTTQSSSAVTVNGIGHVTSTISVGSEGHGCAVQLDFSNAYCWGSNLFGRLGDGTTTNRHQAVRVVGLSGDITSVATGAYSSCAHLSNGSVKCWGGGSSGALGNGSKNDSPTPVGVTGLTSGVLGIGAGGSSACAIMATGVRCWGENFRGKLGNDSTMDRDVPVDVIGLGPGVQQVSVGVGHACVVNKQGGILCWGDNESGELGDGTNMERHTPVRVLYSP